HTWPVRTVCWTARRTVLLTQHAALHRLMRLPVVVVDTLPPPKHTHCINQISIKFFLSARFSGCSDTPPPPPPPPSPSPSPFSSFILSILAKRRVNQQCTSASLGANSKQNSSVGDGAKWIHAHIKWH